MQPADQLSRSPQYRSIKIVRAAKIKTIYSPTCVGIEPDGLSVSYDPAGKPTPSVGWYAIGYADGYFSFSPPESFENGYAAINETDERGV